MSEIKLDSAIIVYDKGIDLGVKGVFPSESMIKQKSEEKVG